MPLWPLRNYPRVVLWAADRTAQNTKFGEAERTLATRPIVSSSSALIPILLPLKRRLQVLGSIVKKSRQWCHPTRLNCRLCRPKKFLIIPELFPRSARRWPNIRGAARSAGSMSAVFYPACARHPRHGKVFGQFVSLSQAVVFKWFCNVIPLSRGVVTLLLERMIHIQEVVGLSPVRHQYSPPVGKAKVGRVMVVERLHTRSQRHNGAGGIQQTMHWTKSYEDNNIRVDTWDMPSILGY